jgi:hypothetical protein
VDDLQQVLTNFISEPVGIEYGKYTLRSTDKNTGTTQIHKNGLTFNTV